LVDGYFEFASVRLKISNDTTMKKKTLIYSTLLIAMTVITAFTFDKRHQENKEQINADYTIVNNWEMPSVLNEVSGIAWIGNNLIACIQDEDGKIFIYDLNQKKITQEIEFAGSGDYEGVAVAGDDAYVMRSDGLLYHIKNFRTPQNNVNSVQTQFDAKNNMESLFYDKQARILLTIPKDIDKEDEFKNVYQMPISNQSVDVNTLMKIAMDAPLLKNFKNKKLYKTLTPSEIAIAPDSKIFYILDGRNPKLLALDSKGDIKRIYQFDKSTFAQPEGLTFSEDGRMFISNEAGKDSKANILEVRLEK